jgi:hypothetical protein
MQRCKMLMHRYSDDAEQLIMVRFYPGYIAQDADTDKQVPRISCAGALKLLRRVT